MDPDTESYSDSCPNCNTTNVALIIGMVISFVVALVCTIIIIKAYIDNKNKNKNKNKSTFINI